MIADPKPPTLAEYFSQERVLSPKYRPNRFHRHRFVVKVHWVTLREYWKKHRPQTYLKGLCSLAACFLSDKDYTFIVPLNGALTAPGKCSSLTDSMKASTLAMCQSRYIFNQLSTTASSMTWLEWAQGRDVTEHLWSQVLFIWTAVSAVSDETLVKETETDKENINTLQSCIPVWIVYLESILDVYVKGRAS